MCRYESTSSISNDSIIIVNEVLANNNLFNVNNKHTQIENFSTIKFVSKVIFFSLAIIY